MLENLSNLRSGAEKAKTGLRQVSISLNHLQDPRETYYRDGAAHGSETLGGARGGKVRDGGEVGVGCGRNRSVVVSS